MWPKTATMCIKGTVPESSRGTGRTMCAPERTYIKVWCAWCEKFLYVIQGHGETGNSHGICQPCVDEIQRTVQ